MSQFLHLFNRRLSAQNPNKGQQAVSGMGVPPSPVRSCLETWLPRSLSTLRALLGHTTKLEVAGDHAQIAQGCPPCSVCPCHPAPRPTWALRLFLQLLPLLSGPVLRVEGPPSIVSGDDLPMERALRQKTEQLSAVPRLACVTGLSAALHSAGPAQSRLRTHCGERGHAQQTTTDKHSPGQWQWHRGLEPSPPSGHQVLAHRPRLPSHLQPVLALAEPAIGPRGSAPVLHRLERPRKGDEAAWGHLGHMSAVQLRVHLARLPEAVLRLRPITRTESVGAVGATVGQASSLRDRSQGLSGLVTGLRGRREGARVVTAQGTPTASGTSSPAWTWTWKDTRARTGAPGTLSLMDGDTPPPPPGAPQHRHTVEAAQGGWLPGNSLRRPRPVRAALSPCRTMPDQWEDKGHIPREQRGQKRPRRLYSPHPTTCWAAPWGSVLT